VPLVKSVRVALDVTGDVAAKAKIDGISARAEELKKAFPEYKVKIDTAAAAAKLALFKHEVKDAGDEAGRQGGPGGGVGILERALASLTGAIGGGGASAGSALIPVIAAAVPVIAGLGTIAAGAGTGITAFAAVAIPELQKVTGAMAKTGAAGKKAMAALTPGERDAAAQLELIGAAWQKMTAVFQPAVLAVISQVAKILTGPTGAIAQVGVIVEESLPGIRQMVAILGQGFLEFLKGMQPLILPSLGAFNMLLQAIVKQLPPLLGAMAKGMPAWIQLAKGIAAVITFGLKLTTWLVELSAWVIPRTIVQLHHWESGVDDVRKFIIRLGHDAEAAFNTMTKAIGRAAHDTVAGVGIAWDTLKLITLRLVDNMLRAFSHIPLIGGMFHSAERAVHREILAIQGDINRLQGHTVKIPVSFVSPAGGRKPLAAGGRLPGFGGGDILPALLEPGEAVVDKFRTRKYAPVLKAMGVPGFAAGGYVDIPERTTFMPSLAAINQAMNQSVYDIALQAARSGLLTPPGAGGDSGARSHSAAVAQAFARSVMGMYGFGPSQWLPLLYLWNQESSWNPYAVNPSSGAYGIPQALGHGHPYNLGDYIAQVDWGLAYIRQRYGSPAGAWAHEQAFNWYQNGGYMAPGGWGVVGEAGPELIRAGRAGATVRPGGNTYNITVKVDSTVHPAEAGRKIVEHILQFEKRSGSSWRN
jgi:hypothetical protein